MREGSIYQASMHLQAHCHRIRGVECRILAHAIRWTQYLDIRTLQLECVASLTNCLFTCVNHGGRLPVALEGGR